MAAAVKNKTEESRMKHVGLQHDVHYGYTYTYMSKNCVWLLKKEIPTQRCSALKQVVVLRILKQTYLFLLQDFFPLLTPLVC